MRPVSRLTPLLALALTARLSAAIVLAPLFQDHAVLQQGKPVPVWGKADPGEHVAVAFSGQTGSATAAPDGSWTVILPALTMSTVGADLVVTGQAQDLVTLHDVLVGEVWLCSGQSNMEFMLYDHKGTTFRVDNYLQEVAAANYPMIRQFLVKRDAKLTPQDSVGGAWAVCSPDTASNFTAVGYFFAREIFRKTGMPIGIIDSTWGGTPVEAWMSPAAVESSPAFAVIKTRYADAVANAPAGRAKFEADLAAWTAAQAEANRKGKAAQAGFAKKSKPREYREDQLQYAPSGLFNAMINPLLPYALKGVLWYQGESNSERTSEYHALFAAMITAWRSHFGQGDVPFYFVQLANFNANGPANTNYAFLREAQAQTLSLPNTGMAVTIDIGIPTNIHPTNKQEVGRRLSLIAMSELYGGTTDYLGPMFSTATPEGTAMRVHFTNAAMGLIARDRPVGSLELAGADKVFHPATGKIMGDTLLVSSPLVPAPVAVRYAFRNAPDANLYNGDGLPAVPFRSDTW